MKIVSMETPNLHDLCITISVDPHCQCWDFRMSWICVYNYTWRFIQILCGVSYLSEINMDFNRCRHIPCVSFNVAEHLISVTGKNTGFLYHNVENITEIYINVLIGLSVQILMMQGIRCFLNNTWQVCKTIFYFLTDIVTSFYFFNGILKRLHKNLQSVD